MSYAPHTLADIVVTRELPVDILEPLRARGEVWVWDEDRPVPRDRLLEELPDAVGLLSMLTDRIDPLLLEAGPRLEVVSQMAVGVDNIDVEECAVRGVRIGHTPGVLTETVADTAFALMAAAVRRLPEAARAVHDGDWGPWSPFWMTGGELHGRRLGIVGMGRVGQAVARRASGFDIEVAYTSPRPVDGWRQVGLQELLAASDIVVLAARLTDETRGLIGQDELGAMREDAYLVNVARGEMVVTDDLVAALDSGTIAGAALDVTDPEPLPLDHPLLALPNCLVTPHIASASVATRRAMATLAVENLLAALEGLEMPAEYPGGG